MNYDEAVRVLGFRPGDSFESHLPVLREAEVKLRELMEAATDETERADYAHQLEKLREAITVVERGPETPAVPETKRKSRGAGRLVVSLVVVAALIVLAWFGADWARKQRDSEATVPIETLLEQGQVALEKRRWPEAEKKLQAILAREAEHPQATEGLQKVAEGKLVERRQQIAYHSGTALSSVESREWDKAEAALAELEKLEPEHEMLATTREKIREGRLYDQIAGLITQAEEAIREERWDDLTTHAEALSKLAPLHVDLPRYRQLSEEGLKLMAERRERARELYQEALALDEGVYSETALEKVREALRLHREPEYEALYEKLAGYGRVIRVPEEFATVTEALEAARANDSIRIAEGTYKEALVIERKISLEGAGAEKTVIECPSDQASVVTVGNGVSEGRIAGLTLRQSGITLTKERFPVVAVGSGSITLEDCRVEKGSGHGIAVVKGGVVRLRNVRVASCGWDGLAVYGEGSHAAPGGELARHGEPVHVLRAQGRRRQGRREPGIDAPAEADADLGEAALVDIITQSQYQGLIELLLLGRVLHRQRGGLRKVHHRHFLPESGQLGHHLPARVGHQGVPVEDELIIAPNEVAVNQGHPGVPRHLLQERAADGQLSQVEGRGAEVEKHVHPLPGELLHGIFPVEGAVEEVLGPDVLADRDPHPLARDHKGLPPVGLLEVTALFEDIVGGQEGLEDPGPHLPPLQEGGGIAEGLAGGSGVVVVEVAHQEGHLPHLPGEEVEGLQTFGDELGLEDEVPWRVTHQGHLGAHHQLRAQIHGLAVGIPQALGVPGKVAHRGVDLHQSHLHGRHSFAKRREPKAQTIYQSPYLPNSRAYQPMRKLATPCMTTQERRLLVHTATP